MKRNGEIGLSLMGAVSSLVMIVVGFFFLSRKDSESYLDYLHAHWSDSEVAATIDQMNQAGTLWVVPGLVGLLLSIIAILMLRGNGRPKPAGWLLILGSVAVCSISVFGYIPALFFIIAGIMALVRKPKGSRTYSSPGSTRR